MRFLTRLRVVGTSATTAAAGIARVARRPRQHARVGLRVGDEAPEFALPASDGRIHRLSEARRRGMVVIAWFPKAFTSGCTMQCDSLARHQRRLTATGATVFAATLDTPETNREFAEALGLDIPILSDAGGRVAQAFGVLGASGFPSRWTFYIGSDGRIVDIDTHVRVSTHGTDIEERLKQLQTPNH